MPIQPLKFHDCFKILGQDLQGIGFFLVCFHLCPVLLLTAPVVSAAVCMNIVRCGNPLHVRRSCFCIESCHFNDGAATLLLHLGVNRSLVCSIKNEACMNSCVSIWDRMATRRAGLADWLGRRERRACVLGLWARARHGLSRHESNEGMTMPARSRARYQNEARRQTLGLVFVNFLVANPTFDCDDE